MHQNQAGYRKAGTSWEGESSKFSPAQISRLFLSPCCVFYSLFLKSGSVVSAKVVGLNVAAYECLGSASVSSLIRASCIIAWSLFSAHSTWRAI